MVSVLFAALLYGIALAVVSMITHRFNQPRLAAAASAIGGLAALLLISLLIPGFQRALGALLRRIAPEGKLLRLPLSLFPLSALGLALSVVIWRVSMLPLGAYQLGPLWDLLSLTLLITALLAARRVLTALQRISKPIIFVFLLASTLALSLWRLPEWPNEHPSTREIPAYGGLSSFTLKGLRALLDGDGDGYAAALGGGDCDDHAPEVHPGAEEVPGNGVDENCFGGDAPLPEPEPEPAPAPATEAPAAAAGARWNVLFLIIDTLRADHLPLYGYDRPTMPHLSAWGAEAQVFKHAYAQAPRTPFSIPSILTGIYPSRLAWNKRGSNYPKLLDRNETLFERFKAGGWRTEAVSSHWYFGPKKAVNLGQGVDKWDNRGALSVRDSNTQSAAASITDRLIARLDTLGTQEQPFFLFGHYFAPHGRYLDHRVRCRQGKSRCHREPLCAEHPTGCQFGDPKARSVASLLNKYDSELAYVDLHLKRLFEALKAQGRYEDTLVVITSDHGESFKDRRGGKLFHGRSVHWEELHVPLLIRAPKRAGAEHQSFVGLVDIAPTLLELTGLSAEGLSGHSLRGLFSGEVDGAEQRTARAALEARVFFSEQLPYPSYSVHQVAATRGDGLKLIQDLTLRRAKAYQLNADIKEQRDLLKRDPAAAKALRAPLLRFIEATPR